MADLRRERVRALGGVDVWGSSSAGIAGARAGAACGRGAAGAWAAAAGVGCDWALSPQPARQSAATRTAAAGRLIAARTRAGDRGRGRPRRGRRSRARGRRSRPRSGPTARPAAGRRTDAPGGRVDRVDRAALAREAVAAPAEDVERAASAAPAACASGCGRCPTGARGRCAGSTLRMSRARVDAVGPARDQNPPADRRGGRVAQRVRQRGDPPQRVPGVNASTSRSGVVSCSRRSPRSGCRPVTASRSDAGCGRWPTVRAAAADRDDRVRRPGRGAAAEDVDRRAQRRRPRVVDRLRQPQRPSAACPEPPARASPATRLPHPARPPQAPATHAPPRPAAGPRTATCAIRRAPGAPGAPRVQWASHAAAAPAPAGHARGRHNRRGDQRQPERESLPHAPNTGTAPWTQPGRPEPDANRPRRRFVSRRAVPRA